MEGRLNIFQRTMLRWRELHPYNALHVLEIPGALDPKRLQEAIRHRLESSGLTGLILDKGQRRFRYQGGPASLEMAIRQGGQDPMRTLSAEIEKQLNAPFPHDGKENPFRFFAVGTEGAFYLGLVYDHFIAGGDSIVLLLKGIVASYQGRAASAGPSPSPRLYPATYRRLLVRYPRQAMRGILVLPEMIATARRACRPRDSHQQDYHASFVYARINPPDYHCLIRAAKGWGVSLHDLFIAALLQAIAPLAPERRAAPRRRGIAVVSVVNIREDFWLRASDAFGQFLASVHVCHPVPDGMSFQQLVHDVHAQTAKIKTEKRYLPGLALQGLANLMWPRFSPDRRHRFHQKYYPVWGGITNLNLNSIWGPAGDVAMPMSYVRAAGTGPATPLVFAITTVGDSVHLGITFRTSVLSRATVDGVTGAFLSRLGAVRADASP